MTHPVLVTTPKFVAHEAYARGFLGNNGCSVIEHPRTGTIGRETLLRVISAAVGYIVGSEPVTDEVFAAAPNLKVITAQGVGYDHIDVEAATRHGVVVCNCAGCNNHAVSEMALGLMLGLARQILATDRAVRAGEWPATTGPELWGKTLGIVGLGQIGKAVCRRAKGFGMQIVAYELYPDAAFAQSWGLRYLPLDELLATADVITLHAPVTPETRHLINRATLALMKPGAFLINTARGELVDEAALAESLRDGRLAGAAADVFATEPPGDSPLLALDNFIATPHSAGQTEDGLRAMGDVTAENALRVLRGEEPLFRVA